MGRLEGDEVSHKRQEAPSPPHAFLNNSGGSFFGLLAATTTDPSLPTPLPPQELECNLNTA